MDSGRALAKMADLLLANLRGAKIELPPSTVDKIGAHIKGNSIVLEKHPFVVKIEAVQEGKVEPTVSVLMNRLVIAHDDFQGNLDGEAEADEGIDGNKAVVKVFQRAAPIAHLTKLVIREDADPGQNIGNTTLRPGKGKNDPGDQTKRSYNHGS